MQEFGNNLNNPSKKEDDFKNRKKRMLATFNLLSRLDVEGIAEDPKKKSEFIRNLSFKEFQNFLLRINGVQR